MNEDSVAKGRRDRAPLHALMRSASGWNAIAIGDVVIVKQ